MDIFNSMAGSRKYSFYSIGNAFTNPENSNEGMDTPHSVKIRISWIIILKRNIDITGYFSEIKLNLIYFR